MKTELHEKPDTRTRLSYALKRLKGIPVETDLKSYLLLVEKIRSYDFRDLEDREIQIRAKTIRKTAGPGVCPDTLTCKHFALTAEAVRRVLDLEVYDVQLAAALVLHRRKLAQVRTGEGKTLAAVFAAALNASIAGGVHVLTANDYLAERDARWMGKVYCFLGLEAGFVGEGMTDSEKKTAYSRDITYATVKQVGFDYLNDGLRFYPEERIMQPFGYCIVDEADFIMIDEARNPMVIAGTSGSTGVDTVMIDQFVRRLEERKHFILDRQGRNCFLTTEGQNLLEKRLMCGGMQDTDALPLFAAANVALQAHHLLVRDVDYLVRSGGVKLIDESTGRIADNRRWPYGLQTALEIKEGLKPQREGEIYSSITVQHFLGLYPDRAAMTATAVSAADEFKRFYGLDTVLLPPHCPERLEHLPDLVYSTGKAKILGLLDEIDRVHRTGRPILIGTKSVRESRELSDRLSERGISHEVLNADNDEKEAALIARAGMLGAVTISTNMAGRGTDICLGGVDGRDREKITTLGGLYVLGTNRHESVRIDNQLRGRAGRQGDPGSSRFLISLEDDLITRYSITDFIPPRYIGNPDPEPVSDPVVAKEIARAQGIIEEQHFQMRTTLRRYTGLIEIQRKQVVLLREDASDRRIFPLEVWEKCQPAGDEAVERLSMIFLHCLDAFWSDHLLWVDHIREGIHLRRLGQEDPLLCFIREASEAFDGGVKRVFIETVEEFSNANLQSEDAAPDDRGLSRPSSTWTYMVNDNPFPNFRVSLLGTGSGGDPAGALAAVFLAPLHILLRMLGKEP